MPAGILEFNDLILWLYGGGGKELEQEMYGNELIVFPLGLTPPEQIWSKRPINTLDDIKGLKIRAAGLSMDLWDKLGASVVLLTGGEVLPALQRGMIDATEFLEPSFDYTMGLHEVCKYRFGPPIHMSNNIFQLARKLGMEIINEKAAKDPFFKKVWESQKAFIEKYKPYHDLTKFD